MAVKSLYHRRDALPVAFKLSADKDDSSDCSSPGTTKTVEKYFAVHLPMEVKMAWPQKDPLVFTDKADALKVIRKYKRARFKVFNSEDTAIEFVQNGSNVSPTTDFTSHVFAEKMSPFKAPKPQDLVRFRKHIENGEANLVVKMINENPRYLVSSGDTPAILQEGSRYNGLHVAAKSCRATICNILLQAISSSTFIKKLYGDSSVSDSEANDRCQILLDLYLNTPDKAWNETPLHFASKMGCIEVVEILVSFPQCDKQSLNKYLQTPLDINCDRATGSNANNSKEIANLLGDHYFVPVLRSDDSLQGVIGEPFQICTPPTNKTDGVDIKLEVKAIAGPMDHEAASAFRKKWKTPPRTNYMILSRPTLYDPYKGIESVGRKLAYQEKVNWTEYWSFLDCFADLKSHEGLNLLEDYLRKRFKENYPYDLKSNKEDKFYKKPVQSTYFNFCSKEGSSNSRPKTSKSPVSPMTDLSSNFEKLSICNGFTTYSTQLADYKKKLSPAEIKQYSSMEKLCQIFARRLVNAFSRGSLTAVISEICHIQTFMGDCRDDNRFNCIATKKIHSRIARMCSHRLTEQRDKNWSLKIVENIIKCEHVSSACNAITKKPFFCVLTKVKLLLEGLIPELPHSCAGSFMLFWENENFCECMLPPRRNRRVNLTSLPRRISFSETGMNNYEKDSEGFYLEVPKEQDSSSLDESDTSDSDEDYYTPPTSPAFGPFVTNDSNDSDDITSSSDESENDKEGRIFFPDDVPPVFIIGDKPSKLDASVLEALSGVEISKHKYPYILHWKCLCAKSMKNSAKESWPSPSLKDLIKRKNREDAQNLTPSWHRSRLVFT